MSTSTTTPSDLTKPASNRLGWRVVDIVVATVLGVATGLIFVFWNGPGYAAYEWANAITPGFGGLFGGIWVLGGPLGALIIRKPGAALFVEVVASSVSALIGNAWGITALLSGLAQGLGAELIFLIFVYRRFSLPVAVLAGATAGAFGWAGELWYSQHWAKGLEYNLIYLACFAVSGAILAGVLAWLAQQGLAKTGVLDRFASGRSSRL